MRAPLSRRTTLLACSAVLAVAPMLVAPTAGGAPATTRTQAAVQVDTSSGAGRDVPAHFVGLSIEWSLIERYMAPSARTAFAHLLGNLDTGVLRIGGSSQDVMEFRPDATNTNAVITPEDLRYLRSTLDAVNHGQAAGKTPAWGVVLGTAMAPPSDKRPFVSPAHAHTFVTRGIDPVFGDRPADVAGIELGNEPDLSYGTSRFDEYLRDLVTYQDAAVTGPWPIIAPNTSEDILPWETVAAGPTRYFHNWPQILDTDAATVRARAGAFGAYASDHFYPLARTCTNKPYRCPSTSALLSDEHLDSLSYQVYTHAGQAAQRGLGYRLEETNTAAGRGADGVSNVAASATYALDMMFQAACPQPPDGSTANRDCSTGAIGVNFHNAEVNAFFKPEEGNAYYNAINYDPTDAIGAPTVAPLYYAMLLFSHFAQGGHALRPAEVSGDADPQLKAWQVAAGPGAQRMFLINKSDHPVTTSVAAPGSVAFVDRMTPYDPSGAAKTLDAARVRIDGRQVTRDGRWPGFVPQATPIRDGQLTLTLGAGEAAVLTTHP